jgi:hypothetical protein
MTVKEYLGQAYGLRQRIDSRLEQLESLNALAVKATSTVNDMPGSPNRNTHQMEDTVVKIVDLENNIFEELSKLVDLQVDIISVIHKVSDPEYQLILELRYLSFMTWEEIAEKMHYGLRYVHMIKRKALTAAEPFVIEAVKKENKNI